MAERRETHPEGGGGRAELSTPEVSDETIERVLGLLEPVDQTTSFEHEQTARIPMLKADPPLPALAGKRRAVKTGHRPPALRLMPSGPVLLGVAALAVAIGGTLSASSQVSAAPSHQVLTQASALTGTSGVGTVSKRGKVVSRDLSRGTSTDSTEGSTDGTAAAAPSASTDTPLVAAANGMAAERSTALDKINLKTEAYAKVLKSNLWITPVEVGVYHLTARFGQYGLWASFHTGLDFAAPTGTPIHAIAGGTITFTAYDGSYGNKTIEQLPDGTEIWYCHQNEFGTAVGDTVTQGEVIGYVGSTGHTTGPHVHIEVRPGGGDPVDPFPAFQQHGITP